jgi:hypothetical protein
MGNDWYHEEERRKERTGEGIVWRQCPTLPLRTTIFFLLLNDGVFIQQNS